MVWLIWCGILRQKSNCEANMKKSFILCLPAHVPVISAKRGSALMLSQWSIAVTWGDKTSADSRHGGDTAIWVTADSTPRKTGQSRCNLHILYMGNNVLCSIHTASSEFSSTAGLMWNLKCLWLLSRSKCSYFFKLILRRGPAARKRRQEV